MKKYILLISALVSIGFTGYVSLLPLNGVSQADISNLYTTPITPAGFSFSIWSIIYLSWLVLAIYVLIKKPQIKKSLRYKLVASQLLSAIWLIPWHYEYVEISLLVILTIFKLLWQIMAHKKTLDICFHYTVSLFFGWISIASLLNLNIALIEYNLYTYPNLYSIISLALWLMVSLYWIYKKSNFIVLLVFIWAIIWIIMK